MVTIAPLLTSVAIAFWIIAIAIISVQNATPITLKFLTFESISIPVGLLLAFCICLGIMGMALLLPLWSLTRSRQTLSDNDPEFFVDE